MVSDFAQGGVPLIVRFCPAGWGTTLASFCQQGWGTLVAQFLPPTLVTQLLSRVGYPCHSVVAKGGVPLSVNWLFQTDQSAIVLRTNTIGNYFSLKVQEARQSLGQKLGRARTLQARRRPPSLVDCVAS
jgi:hypothetical protein